MSAGSQNIQLKHNNPYAKEAYFGVPYIATLHKGGSQHFKNSHSLTKKVLIGIYFKEKWSKCTKMFIEV